MRTSCVILVIGYLIVAAVELAIHVYLAYGTSDLASAIRASYLHRDSLNGKQYVAGMVDLVMPAAALGVLVGVVDVRTPIKTMLGHVVILAAGMLLLFQLYDALAKGSSYPLPHIIVGSGVERILGVIPILLKPSCIIGAVAYFSRQLRIDVLRRRDLAS